VVTLPLYLLLLLVALAGGRPVFEVEARPHFHGSTVRVRKLRTPALGETGWGRGALRAFYRRLPAAAAIPCLYGILIGRLSFVGPSQRGGEGLPRRVAGSATMRPVGRRRLSRLPWMPFQTRSV
jgi:hypothetical protein